jgi:ATP-dependent exoDNAse (exonuclease V) beta subunit
VTQILDATERSRALDTGSSFCVTAPAGSGKTELLIQRYLGLLEKVGRPEQVLAITFTRKAAAEMRERVFLALQHAEQGKPCEGAHEQVTRQLALAALDAGAVRDWHLTRDIGCLNIKTIDSFCAGLTRQMPVLSAFGGQAQTEDNAAELYRDAVGELFELLGSSHEIAPDLDALVLHFDNNWERLEELLVAMLGRRDQWHSYMGVQYDPTQAEQRLTNTVEQLIAENLLETSHALEPFKTELHELLCYALENLGEPVPETFPAAMAHCTSTWRQLRDLLLTQKGTWRKTVNKKNGFPAGKGQEQERKEQLAELVQRMAQQPGLVKLLDELSWLPQMGDNAASWQLVLHLSRVLPVLSACLLLVFQRRGCVDHTQVALSALQALGDDESPTELALRLDYCIEHILVDEFQDTAINQFDLVTRLTRGWGEHNAANPECPRTLFIVGDGMQSIYGFRDANVGLFLKAQQQGFNGVHLVGLELKCNFRSNSDVVEWVNRTFRVAFPAEDNIRRGRVGYSEAVAVNPRGESAAVETHGFLGDSAREQEARWLVDTIAGVLASREEETVALLGRSRSHLAPTLQLLRAEGIDYGAQDMDALGGSPVIVDLMSLCRGLANPADRVAWLSLLRAPWCGLQLSDLRIVVASEGDGLSGNLARIITDSGELNRLSGEGQARLAHLSSCMRWALDKRDRLSLRVWIEQLWMKLDGPASVIHQRQLSDARRFFELLEQAELEGVGLQPEWLQQRLDRLYAAGDDPESRLQVMTLHKSKGLEFDWVFIPALARGTRSDSREILLWDEYNSPDGERGFLLAADDHSPDRAPSLYNFLKRSRRDKSRQETTRLLYVGATRAARNLRLSACLDTEDEPEPETVPEIKDPSGSSLLAPIWNGFRQQMILHQPSTVMQSIEVETSPPLIRFKSVPDAAPELFAPSPPVDANIPTGSLNWADRYVGTVVHQMLESLSLLPELPAELAAQYREGARHALARLGLAGGILEQAQARVYSTLSLVLKDERGRWLLNSGHGEAHSELPLSYVTNEGLVSDIVIDRTFVDRESGLRWVVDYKTSTPADGESPEDFALREGETYRTQLRAYRDALSLLHGAEPLRCALYFTSVGLFYHLPELDQ